MKKILTILIILGIIAAILFVLLQVIKVQDIILRKLFKKDYSEYVEIYAEEYDIDPLLIYSIIKAESGFNPKARSRSGAYGLMQVMEDTAVEVAEKQSIRLDDIELLYEPAININIGVAYFKELKEKYNGNELLAIIAYNGGIGNVDRWIREETIKPTGEDIENVPFKETNMYVRRIVKNYEIYKDLY